MLRTIVGELIFLPNKYTQEQRKSYQEGRKRSKAFGREFLNKKNDK
jgi:hypothetical protein